MYVAKTAQITHVRSGIYTVVLWIQSSRFLSRRFW